jgi:hypothetical protein
MMRLALLGCGIALFGVAPTAHAQGVTNPAEHPAPITVTIDGQTYRDGQDTLPGYDDEACTPIPNVQYDFASDEIQYYSGDGELLKTAHWTEWSRISSYETWKEQQQAGQPTATPTPTSTSSATATPAPSSNTTTSPSTTSPSTTSPSTTSPSATSTTSPSTKRSSTKRSTTATTSPSTKSPTSVSTTPSSSKGTTSTPSADKSHTSTAPSTDAAATAAPVGDAAPTDTAGATVPAGSSAPTSGASAPASGAAPVTSSPQPTTKFKLASERLGGGVGDNRLAGVAILAALFGVAGFGLVFRGFARLQGFGRR